MSYLFYIDPKNNIVLHPDCVKLCPELSGLDEDETVFIIKAFDNHSPLRRYPEQDRVRRAMLEVWRDNKPKILSAIESKDPHHRINAAIAAYKMLQYDRRVELINTYQETVEQIQSTIHAGLNDKDMDSKLKNIKRLRDDIKALEAEIYEGILDDGPLKANKDLSLIEILQKDPVQWRNITSRKK